MAQLCQHQDEFKRLNTEVLIIAFGALPLAQAWLEETCAPFRLLLDPERTVYQAYGLERSLWRSWNLKTVQRYVQLMRDGRQWRGIQGDSTRLGGTPSWMRAAWCAWPTAAMIRPTDRRRNSSLPFSGSSIRRDSL